MDFVLYFKEFGNNLYYLLQADKCKVLWFDLCLQELILDLKVLIITRNLQISFFYLKENVLVLNVLHLERESLI